MSSQETREYENSLIIEAWTSSDWLVAAILARHGRRRVVQESDWLSFLSGAADARAEEGVHLATRPIGERVEQTHIVRVIEGDPPLLAV